MMRGRGGWQLTEESEGLGGAGELPIPSHMLSQGLRVGAQRHIHSSGISPNQAASRQVVMGEFLLVPLGHLGKALAVPLSTPGAPRGSGLNEKATEPGFTCRRPGPVPATTWWYPSATHCGP